jgi:ubiquinone/menaquinone biosynthesis C-methylase UbiE
MSKSFMKLDPSWWIDQSDYFFAHSEFWFKAVNINNSRCDLALDLGCGHGRFTIPLTRTSETVVSTDINRKMLKSLRVRARKFNVLNKIYLVVADAQHLPFRDCCFDMVNFIGTMVHILNQKKAIKEEYRITRVGGRVIVDQTNYVSLRYLWEVLKTAITCVVKVGRPPELKIFVKRCNLWGFKRMFREVGLSISKVEGLSFP